MLSPMNFLNEGTSAIGTDTFKKMMKIFDAHKAVFKLKTANGDQGTGSLYEVIDKFNKSRFLIMTCNHVLPSNSINEIIEATLEFEYIADMKSFLLKKEDLKHIWTNKLLDATIIEISSERANLFKSYGALFLKISKNIFSNFEFGMLQYPKGIFSISYGNIESVQGYNVFYQVGTAPGSSGSPLLDPNCNAIAMHKGGQPDSDVEKPEIWRRATVLSSVVEAYLVERPQIDPLMCAIWIFTSK